MYKTSKDIKGKNIVKKAGIVCAGMMVFGIGILGNPNEQVYAKENQASVAQKDTVIKFADRILEEKIKKELGLNETENITTSNILKLKELDISNSEVKILAGLEYAVNLEALNLYNTKDFNGDLSYLKTLKSLYSLNAGKANITDISPIASLAGSLTGVSFEFNPMLADKDNTLASLKKLKILSISGTKIDSLKFLKDMHDLESLYIGRLPLDAKPYLEYIQQNMNLKELSMSNLQIDSIEFVKDLKELHLLSIANNHVSDLRPLSQTKVDVSDERTFDGTGQTIQLDKVKLGESTHLSLFLPNGELPKIDWVTPGGLAGEKLIWKNIGKNELSFTSENTLFTGSVKQFVEPSKF